jgi:2-oxoglutarate ferredoxin oxidoreductase subunit beta
VGRHNIHVHDASNPNPSVAFALSRLAHGPYGPTPLGIFRNVPAPSYGRLLEDQIAHAKEKQGPGDLAKVIRSRGTWTVE